MKLILALIATLSMSASALANKKYTLDVDHSSVGFKIAHLVVSKVNGRFDKYEAQFDFDPSSSTLTGLNAKIDVDSINTNHQKRDAHLRNPDFFGVRDANGKLVEAKRWMTFTADGKTKLDKSGKKSTPVVGQLSLNGVTKPITLNVKYTGEVTDPWGNVKIGFEATGKLARKDFNIAWNKTLEKGGLVVGEDVDLLIEGEAIAAKDATMK